MKLYLKRVLTTFVFLNALIILTGIFSFVVSRILFFFELPDTTLYLIGFVPAIIVLLYVAYIARWENKHLKQQYFETLSSNKYSFGTDYVSTLKAKENIVHTLAFSTLLLAESIPIAISVHTPIVMFIVKFIILLITRGGIFYALNTLVWCFVHRKWHKGRYSTQNSP